MKLSNPLKTLTWDSLFRSSRSRLRRRRTSYAPVNLAAEVLEERALLSGGNVTALATAVAGVGSLTLTSDSGDNTAYVYRLNSTTVEVDGIGGTTINNATFATFALSTVTGITVNLGSGYDTYTIYSPSGDPALDIGAGGVL